MSVIDAGLRDKALVFADDADGLLECDAGLLAIGSGEDAFAGRLPLRADCVDQRQRRRERGLAVAARQEQHYRFDNARAVRMARAIDAADDALLPFV